jgi:hydroxypyruvate isomerase
MPRFAANLTTMFPEWPLIERFKAAADVGFTAVELLQPYPVPVADIAEQLKLQNLQLILINTPMGDVANGERGLAALPGREEDFRQAFAQSLEYAIRLKVPMIHVMAGVVPDGVSNSDCCDTFVRNLKQAAVDAASNDIQLLLEPLNTLDVPGYLYTSTAEARNIIERVGQPNVRLQYDFYHLQIMQGNLAAGVSNNLDIIGHIQFSSVPGRHEPQFGEVNLGFLFDFLDEVNYAGWVGCEYRPKESTLEGLSWASQYGLG